MSVPLGEAAAFLLGLSQVLEEKLKFLYLSDPETFLEYSLWKLHMTSGMPGCPQSTRDMMTILSLLESLSWLHPSRSTLLNNRTLPWTQVFWLPIFSSTFHVSSVSSLLPSQFFCCDFKNFVLLLGSSFVIFTEHFFHLLFLSSHWGFCSHQPLREKLHFPHSESGGTDSILLIKLLLIGMYITNLNSLYLSPLLSSTNIPVTYSFLLKIGALNLEATSCLPFLMFYWVTLIWYWCCAQHICCLIFWLDRMKS